ncbi:MAG TPA: TonB C-terminal domain-containing protein [Rhizomicrobium sp.]|jgi:TonB family protein
MTIHTFDNPFDQEPKRSWLAYGVGVLILVLIALGIWRLANSQAVSIKKEEPVSQLMSVVPPPPTPPPPKPQEVVKQNVPVPTTQPQQVQPKAQAPANNAITENAPAQDSGDAFNIGAGNGQGMTGGGGAGFFNPAMFNAYIAGIVKIAVQKDDTLKNKSFRAAVSVWLSPQGKITKATLRSSTGSDSYDAALTALLLAMPPLEQPPPQQILARLPVEMTIDLRKSL